MLVVQEFLVDYLDLFVGEVVEKQDLETSRVDTALGPPYSAITQYSQTFILLFEICCFVDLLQLGIMNSSLIFYCYYNFCSLFE